tara:strand:- start:410 stop:1402 length:993 start_codon:yes stop_codon:yes gene_type:complete
MSLNKRLATTGASSGGPSEAFNVLTYSGNSSSQSLNYGFKPGIFWPKSRSTSGRNYLTYNLDGTGKYLFPSSTQIEEGTGSSISFTNSGIDLTASFGWNHSGITYVGPAWGLPASGSSNTSGSVTTTTYAYPDAGQSMFTYTGDGASTSTIGHGLSSAPEFVVIKTRSHVSDWPVYHSGLSGNNYRLRFNSDAAQDTTNNPWNSSAPTSSIINLGGSGNVNISSRTFWGMAFHSVSGYSKFGTYTGAGSAQTINIGFQPDHVWIKSRGATDNWAMFDSARGAKLLYINDHGAEEDFSFAFTSNGFEVPSTSGMTNGSGLTYVYCAWKISV